MVSDIRKADVFQNPVAPPSTLTDSELPLTESLIELQGLQEPNNSLREVPKDL
jgi:hypothetical protein